MKKKDLGTIAIVAIVSAFLSIIISGNFLTTEDDRSQDVEVIESLSDEFENPSSVYFNDKSINPTKLIEIFEDPNSNPFGEE